VLELDPVDGHRRKAPPSAPYTGFRSRCRQGRGGITLDREGEGE